jgi:protein MPE1
MQNRAAWQKQLSKRVKVLTEAEVRDRAPSDPKLACPIDRKLFREAVKTPCCSTTYCEECIQSHLLERDFVCPNCERKVPGLDKLHKDLETRTAVATYIEKVIEDSKHAEDGADGPADQPMVVSQAWHCNPSSLT